MSKGKTFKAIKFRFKNEKFCSIVHSYKRMGATNHL
jgi:hypothetical protein